MSERVLVLGLGRTGLSLVRHFAGRGCEVAVADERESPPQAAALSDGFPGVPIRRVGGYAELAGEEDSFGTVAVSPGIPPSALPQGIAERAVGDLSCFVDAYRARWPTDDRRPTLIAVTGTNGKSTAATLAAGMLGAAGGGAEAVGNIGVPLLDAAARWEEDGWPRHVVAELSSFQLARLSVPLGADVACLLNLTPDHLDWHGSEQAYREAKGRVFGGAAVGIVDATDESCRSLAAAAATICSFGPDQRGEGRWRFDGDSVSLVGCDGASVAAERLLASGIVPATACAALSIAGCAAGWRGCEEDLRWLEGAGGLPHRFETVSEVSGVRYVNDSKATNEAAARAALSAVGGKCVLIAGGEGKGQSFRRLAESAAGKAAAAVLIGADAEEISAELEGGGIPCKLAGGMDEAVRLAAEQADRLGAGTVLLSPACASQDGFADFAERGEAFRRSVAGLAEREHVRA